MNHGAFDLSASNILLLKEKTQADGLRKCVHFRNLSAWISL